MGKKEAEAMKRLRKKRISNGLCTRCGKPAQKGNHICSACATYKKSYLKKKRAEQHKPIRKLKSYDIKNQSLYNRVMELNMSTSQLARAVGVSCRTVLRWIFEGSEPMNRHKFKLTEVLGKDIYLVLN